MIAARRSYRFADGTTVEPRDTAGRGCAVHHGGWYVTYATGQRVETRATLAELRAAHGKAVAL